MKNMGRGPYVSIILIPPIVKFTDVKTAPMAQLSVCLPVLWNFGSIILGLLYQMTHWWPSLIISNTLRSCYEMFHHYTYGIGIPLDFSHIISICNEINFKGLEKKIYISCNGMSESLWFFYKTEWVWLPSLY